MLSRRELLVLGLGTAGCASLRPTVARPVARAPLVYDERGGLFVDARIEDRPSSRFILDTGASESTLSPAAAAALGLRVRAGHEVSGSAGSVSAGQTQATVELPGVAAHRLEFVVYDFHSYDPRVVGILGYQLLRGAPFQLRYARRELVWNPRPPAATVPMVLDGQIPRIAATVNGIALDLRVDSGATFRPSADAYLNVTQAQAARLGLTGAPVEVFTATGTGSAKLELPVYRLASLSIAARTFSRAFAIVQPRVGYFARPDAVGFVGNAVLDKLDPYFDYAGGRFGVGA